MSERDRAPIGGDGADLGLGVSFAIAQAAVPAEMAGFLQYDATVASHETVNSVAGGVRVKW